MRERGISFESMVVAIETGGLFSVTALAGVRVAPSPAPLRLGSRCSDVWRAAVAARADLRGDSRTRRVPHPKVHAESLGGGSFINFIVTMKSLQFALDQMISVPVGQCSQPKVWDNPTHSGMAWAKGASVPS